jgi:hypothetical protein
MISPQNLHRILFTSIFMLTTAFLFILQHFLRLVNRIVFNVEHNSRCGTPVEGFALNLLNGVWNTPYPAFPNCFAILDRFPPPTGRKRRARRGAYKREKITVQRRQPVPQSISPPPPD